MQDETKDNDKEKKEGGDKPDENLGITVKPGEKSAEKKELKEAKILLEELKEQRDEQKKLLDEQRELINELKQHQKDAHPEGQVIITFITGQILQYILIILYR